MSTAARETLDLVIGVVDGGLNGIEAYAEAVADAAVGAGHRVVLLASTDEVAATVRRRGDPALEVVSLGLAVPRRLERLAGRVSYRALVGRLGARVRPLLDARGQRFDVAHLSRPPLAAVLRPYARRVVVAAWFHPHALGGRLQETWRHTRGPLGRRVLLTGKSVSYYVGDARGYRDADLVVAPTRLLAEQLAAQGLRAVACPPPVRLGRPDARAAAGGTAASAPRGDGPRRLLVVSGDLSHPRKHLDAAVDALRHLAEGGRAVALHAIGRHGEGLLRRARDLPSSASLILEGPRRPEEVRAAMAASDALVLPSRYEEWGYVAVEALLEGTPVATFPVYPFSEMLDGGLGEVAAGTRPEDLAAALAAILDRPRPADLAARAAARFGAGAVGERLTDLWLGRRPRGAGPPAAPASRLEPTGSPPPPP